MFRYIRYRKDHLGIYSCKDASGGLLSMDRLILVPWYWLYLPQRFYYETIIFSQYSTILFITGFNSY